MFNKNKNALFLAPTDLEEINQINKNVKKSLKHDNISPRLLKSLHQSLATPISLLVNKSLLEGTVPDLLKVAMISPIYSKPELTTTWQEGPPV